MEKNYVTDEKNIQALVALVEKDEKMKHAFHCIGWHLYHFWEDSKVEQLADLGMVCATCKYVNACNWNHLSRFWLLEELTTDIRYSALIRRDRKRPQEDGCK